MSFIGLMFARLRMNLMASTNISASIQYAQLWYKTSQEALLTNVTFKIVRVELRILVRVT